MQDDNLTAPPYDNSEEAKALSVLGRLIQNTDFTKESPRNALIKSESLGAPIQDF